MQDHSNLFNNSYQCLIENSGEEGFFASSRKESFGCFFGRDSILTTLKVLRARSKKNEIDLLESCHRSLLSLIQFQGKVSAPSGEQPGKFVHEVRKDPTFKGAPDKPLFLYPDGTLRNYDSLDSTPLGLIAIYNYWQTTQDKTFLLNSLDAVEAGLNWIISYGDLDKDLLVEYKNPPGREEGLVSIQSWTDSPESILNVSGQMPEFPIAPVEVQAYCWLALKIWSDFYIETNTSVEFGRKLLKQSIDLKKRFNELFILKDRGFFYAAQALDGNKNQLKTITANPMLCLWAAYKKGDFVESIVEKKYIDDFVQRSFQVDLFVANAGIRTMSSLAETFIPHRSSYHNGSFWPILNCLVVEGLENFGFSIEAQDLKNASLDPIAYFGSPIELYLEEGGRVVEFCRDGEFGGCRNQSWSAASILDLLT